MDKKTREIVEKVSADLAKEKITAAGMFRTEFRNLISWTAFAEKYFDRTQSWISQKFKACDFYQKDKAFTPSEYNKLVSALRDMAKKLNDLADNIEKAD